MKVAAENLRAMLAKADEKIAAANRELQAGSPGEAASRAYYAVFHAIAAVLATRALAFSSHAQTIGAFNREFVKSGIFSSDTTRVLQNLFEDRHTADYDWVNDVDMETGTHDVSAAEILVAECRAHVEGYIRENAAPDC